MPSKVLASNLMTAICPGGPSQPQVVVKAFCLLATMQCIMRSRSQWRNLASKEWCFEAFVLEILEGNFLTLLKVSFSDETMSFSFLLLFLSKKSVVLKGKHGFNGVGGKSC